MKIQSDNYYSSLVRLLPISLFTKFMISKHDRAYFYLISMGLLALWILMVTLIVGFLLPYAFFSRIRGTNLISFAVDESVFEYESLFFISAILLFYTQVFLVTVFRNVFQVSRSLCRIWVDVCIEQKCDIKHLYATIFRNSEGLDFYSTDPVGILKPQRAELSDYQKETDETLREIIKTSSSSWNRNIAALALASHHSDFGKFLFSADLDGKAPGRNISASIDRKTIEKVGDKLGLTQESLVREFESLNEFLGWDVKNGFKAQLAKRERVAS